MNYFEKIEAYVDQQLNPVERAIFEEELAENSVLQAEFEAYQLADSLFNFTATHISEEEILEAEAVETAAFLINFISENVSETEILAANAEETAGLLINFTAKNLSATEIGAVLPINTPQKMATVRTIYPSYRKLMAAASVLLIIGFLGLNLYEHDSSALDGENTIAAIEQKDSELATILTDIPVEPIINKAEEIKEVIATTTIEIAPVEVKKSPKKKRKYDRAKVIMHTPETNLATTLPTTTSTSSSIALNTTIATEINTSSTITNGQTVVYQVDKGITLKPGFHAEAGASFMATSSQVASPKDIIYSGEITAENPVNLSASHSIILSSGFQAKAGSTFTILPNKAETIQQDISTDAVISDKEIVVFKAGNSITLKAGFHAKAGAGFEASVTK